MSSGIWKVTGFLPRVSRVTLCPSCAAQHLAEASAACSGSRCSRTYLKQLPGQVHADEAGAACAGVRRSVSWTAKRVLPRHAPRAAHCCSPRSSTSLPANACR